MSIKCNTPAGVLATAAADVDRDGGRSVRSTVLPAPWERWLDGCPLRGRDRLLARAILVRAARDARELEGVRRA